MKQAKISTLQLLYVMVGFEFGTVMILGAGGEAKQDAWVVIVTAMIFSLLLMGICTKLAAFYPDDTLVQMMSKIIGKFFSFPLILIYIFYFTYLAARGCRDFGELIVSTILVDTPIAVVNGSFIVFPFSPLQGLILLPIF
ncbi:GerAB/ArcD/ProY family transporter [Metabacillus arenae]|uniref:GerAB/ArcD/ProY family transporter n=1 Tax=Metabacillus arenae TaxID=2771434 RepID=UPI001CD0CBEC|nr:GerAB/ArcD/ProY family transporter [Metabacillus arenae]